RHIVLAHPPHDLVATHCTNYLREAVHEASDSDIRALLVRAEGPTFSHGGDILDFIDTDFNSWRTFIGETHHAYRAIEALQIPTVVAVRGAAFGGAFELALACDFIVAAENCTFRSLEASVGSAPVAGAVQRLAERAGRAMDATHREFVERVEALMKADDAGIPQELDALAEHLRAHFDEEREWMESTGFPSAACHLDEHDAVLRSVNDVQALVAAGELRVA